METSKKYRLLKDLPGVNAGAIFSKRADECAYFYEPENHIYPKILNQNVEKCPDWFEEVKEPPPIPEDQAWVVPGKKYASEGWKPGTWFKPEFFDFNIYEWVGICNDLLKHWATAECMDQKEFWKEYVEPKRKAPAYRSYFDGTSTGLSTQLFESAEDALKAIGSYFISWPALPDSDGFYPGPKVEPKCTS